MSSHRRLRTRIARIGAAGLIIAGAAAPGRAVSDVEVDGRLQIGALHDSNVLEQVANEEDDQALQVFGAIRLRAPLSERVVLRSSARVGLQRYRDISDDSRVLGETRWGLAYRAENGLGLRGDLLLEGRDYADSTSSRGYGAFRADVAFDLPPVRGFTAEVRGSRVEVDYKVTPGREQAGNRLEAALQRRIGRHLLVRVRGAGGSFRFNRPSWDLDESAGALVRGPFDQKDSYGLGSVDLTFVRRTLLSLGYTYFVNDSNSFGRAYFYHRVDVTFRRRIEPLDTSIGVVARREWRTYRDDLDRFVIVDFDFEREQNNGVTLEVDRALTTETSIELRLGWEYNEAIILDQFYDKLLGGVYVEWRF